MNHKIITFIPLLSLLFISGCSTTPGDAANRGGHPEQAAELYMKGAKQGDSTAALKLGLLISEDKVPSSKYGSGVSWYIKACDLGSNPGCHNAGNSFEYGKVGANVDYKKARNYYEIAAKKGYMQSQYNLGTLYSNKYFNDDIEGLKWILIAQKTANNCSDIPLCQWVMNDPPGHKAKLMKRMSEKQIAEAQKLANEWKVN